MGSMRLTRWPSGLYTMIWMALSSCGVLGAAALLVGLHKNASQNVKIHTTNNYLEVLGVEWSPSSGGDVEGVLGGGTPVLDCFREACHRARRSANFSRTQGIIQWAILYPQWFLFDVRTQRWHISDYGKHIFIRGSREGSGRFLCVLFFFL